MIVQAGISCQWTADSQRLILEDFDMICASPSHIYSSALQFSPPSSWLHQHYNAEYSQDIKVVKGPSAGWGTCFRTVLLDGIPWDLVCWEDTIAVGLGVHIIILDAITGSQMTVFSGHTADVLSLTFSKDGTLLASGSADNTIKLWDMQTGGVVKTFQGHTGSVKSVSISVDCTTIASGSSDKTIGLWNIQTGECHCIIQQESGDWIIQQEIGVHSIHFFPLDPQHFISISNGKVQEWNIDGHKIAPEYDGFCVAFSFDGSKFVLCYRTVVQVQSSDSRAVVAEFHTEKNIYIQHCCFSPDGRLVATAVHHAISGHQAIYVWDITNSEPCLLETFNAHVYSITSLVFSSPTSLISASSDQSVKFWQIGAPSTSPDVTDLKSIPHTSPIKSITLQAKDGIAISSDSDGVVRIWDLSTGLCKASFQTPAKGTCLRDVQLIDSRLILVWCVDRQIHVWDVEKGELLQMIDVPRWSVDDLRISGDGSKVLCMQWEFIHAWYIWTGEAMGKVELHNCKYEHTFLTIDGSKVWVNFPEQGIEGWDFGVPDSSSIEHYREPPDRPYPDFIGGIRRGRSFLPGIVDTVTGRVFQLSLRYTQATDAQWDGRYLVAGYDTGEVLILDCDCLFSC